MRGDACWAAAHTALPRELPHQATVRFTSTFFVGGRMLNLVTNLHMTMRLNCAKIKKMVPRPHAIGLLFKMTHSGMLHFAGLLHPHHFSENCINKIFSFARSCATNYEFAYFEQVVLGHCCKSLAAYIICLEFLLEWQPELFQVRAQLCDLQKFNRR